MRLMLRLCSVLENRHMKNNTLKRYAEMFALIGVEFASDTRRATTRKELNAALAKLTRQIDMVSSTFNVEA